MEMVFPKKRNEGIRGILLMPVPRVWTIPRPVSLLDSYIYMSIGQINVLNRLVCLYFGYKTCFWLGFGQEWRTPKLHSLEMSHWNGNLLLRYQYVCILYTYISDPLFLFDNPRWNYHWNHRVQVPPLETVGRWEQKHGTGWWKKKSDVIPYKTGWLLGTCSYGRSM